MQGILLTGMPYAGKSTAGKEVADLLGFQFFDGDTEIEKLHPDRQRYLDENGDDAYIDMEAKVIMGLPLKKVVHAPGGSIIYSKDVKSRLKDCFKVYLKVSLDVLKERITDDDRRGIVRLKHKGIGALYAERERLFNEYFDATLAVDGLDPDAVARAIVSLYALHNLTTEKRGMRYVSTNSHSTASFSEAMKLGLAPDKGLFVPETIPSFPAERLRLMRHLTYPQTAFVVMRQFADIPDDGLRKMCEDAYTFDVPIEGHEDITIARMDRGPTASFKDFAAQLLSRMMTHAADGRKLAILTATSGDTGGAVAAAFKGLPHAQVAILMPLGEVTDTQRRQMTTAGGNITAVCVKGTFDDCQALAKRAFSEMKGLSSANSISVGRLLPQVAYHFYVWGRSGADTIVVPSGNLGSLVAGIIAKRMGLPVRFIAAVNANDEVPRFFSSGSYAPVVPSKACISNAMNIGNPSNLARLVWLYDGRMDEKGNILKQPDMEAMKKDILAVSITDDETREAIKDAYAKGIVLEPHGAVGYAAVQKLSSRGLGKAVLLETAHPVKFPRELKAAGVPFTVPLSLAGLEKLEEHYLTIEPDFGELRKIIGRMQQ